MTDTPHKADTPTQYTILDSLRAQIKEVYLGSTTSIDQLLCCLLARGHALLEDVPGVGKTLLASSLAKSIDASFSRIQLTPDMMPADVLGYTVLSRDSGEMRFQKGPLFASIILADEINRTSPRTQSALLEAMSDGQVSMDGNQYDLPQPFMVVATQNPNDFIGTYPLPENQLDRFLMRISLGYPDAQSEQDLLELRPSQTMLSELKPVIHADQVRTVQDSIDEIHLSPAVREYIVSFARATRNSDDIDVGISPRGSLALAHASRAWAWIQGRDHVIPDDVYTLLVPVCAHRLVIGGPSTGAQWNKAADIIKTIAHEIDAPV
ncbi:MAG: MoxR family ATPase [Phycisphaerales bacterium]|nr:MoxR family ATPase [Phycisphaerales bacterium]